MRPIIAGPLSTQKNSPNGSGIYAALAAAFFTKRAVELIPEGGQKAPLEIAEQLIHKGITLYSPEKKSPADHTESVLLAMTEAPAKSQREQMLLTKAPAFMITAPSGGDAAGAKEVIARSGLVFLSLPTALALTGAKNALDAGEKILAIGTANVAITMGEHGFYLLGKDQYGNENLFRGLSYPSRKTVDTTGHSATILGATAGFLANRGNENPGFGDIREALVRAEVVASFASEGTGTAKLEATSFTDYERRLDHFRSITHW
jgi:hypothetical protein